MDVRPITDLARLMEIHRKYYAHEFTFPEFTEHYFYTFEVVEGNKVVTAGGIRAIPELILMTDLETPVRDRKTALYTALDFSIYGMQKLRFDSIHAFVQDRKWEERLIRTGFHKTKGNALVLGI